MPLLADRVAQASTDVGNAVAFALAAALAGYRTFGAGIGYATTTYYAIVHKTNGTWEVGIGTVTAGAPDTLNRNTVLDGSSGPGVKVNFAAGDKDVFVDLPASKVIVADDTGLTTLPGALTAPGLITASAGVAITGGASSTGRLTQNAVTGLQMRGIVGSTYDVEITNATGNSVMLIPTGSTQATFPGKIVSAAVSGEMFKVVAAASGTMGTASYMQWYRANGSTTRGYVGFGSNDDPDLHMATSDASGKLEFYSGATILALTISTSQTALFTAGVEALSAILDQGAADDAILQFRSSDVAHGMTGLAATSTYGALQKVSSTDGGLYLQGFTESSIGLFYRAFVTSETGTRSTSALAAHYIDGQLKSGVSAGAMSADRNILAVANNGVAHFFLDTDGDSHQDVGTAWTNFDAHDDVALLNLLAANVTRRDDPLRKSFGKWMRQNRNVLERAKLVTFNRDGHHFVNMSRLTMLHTGALRQIGARLDRVVNVLQEVGVPAALLN